MARKRVLYVSHGHPDIIPGGAEVYSLELYQAMKAGAEFEPVFLARTGAPGHRFHIKTPFRSVDGDPNQTLVYSDINGFDSFFTTVPDRSFYTVHYRDFLNTWRPDVVHIQHTLFLGYSLIRETRNVLPRAPIVYTLHEYLPICHASGQMVRLPSRELCDRASPARCHECFPHVTPQKFFLRERWTRAAFELVDVFLAPSRFLLERYVAWGIPREKIRYLEYGRRLQPPAPARALAGGEKRGNLGFFGQLNSYKGLDVLLAAMRLLSERGLSHVHLYLHGANLENQPAAFQEEFRSLVKERRANVTMIGRYKGADLPALMAHVDWVIVPSTWWENSPLVVQEAFMHGRPVICSGVGGMAEKVTDGVDGLHFRVADPESLAATIARAVNTEGLWERLREGISQVYPIEDAAQVHSDLYGTLVAGAAPPAQLGAWGAGAVRGHAAASRRGDAHGG